MTTIISKEMERTEIAEKEKIAKEKHRIELTQYWGEWEMHKMNEDKDKRIAVLEKQVMEKRWQAYNQITSKEWQAERVVNEAYHQIAEIKEQGNQQIVKKRAEIYALELTQQRLYNELLRNNEKQIAGIEKHAYQQIAEKKTEIYGLKLMHQRLYNELASRNADYLRIRRSLHIRCVCEEFEQSRLILNNVKPSRIQRWKEMILSNDPDFQDIKDAIKKHGLDINIVPTIASQLFQKINEDVNGDLAVNRDKLLVVEKYFNQDELKLVKAIIETYPITDVKYN